MSECGLDFKLIGGADEATDTSKRCRRVKFNEQADANPGKCELNLTKAAGAGKI